MPKKRPTYPLAPNAVFRTVQGEGALMGIPMAFVRLAGCSVGCKDASGKLNCDTDWRVAERATPQEIARRIGAVLAPGVKWVWLTGGEPCDHDLKPLYAELRALAVFIALATAGHKEVTWPKKADGLGPDFLSVSPHSMTKWVQRRGDQLNIVPGLNNLRLPDVERELEKGYWFGQHFCTPLYGDAQSVRDAVAFVERHQQAPQWRLGVQAHKLWGVP